MKIHRSTLSRIFYDEFHIHPSTYLTRNRIQTALSLLQETNRPISEVAAASGFRDPNYFCRVINKAYGVSPSKLREIGF